MDARGRSSERGAADSTPELPRWIREAQVRGYATAHRLVAGERRLFGTETLWGDWSGRVLVLAKDWGPSRLLRERVAAGEATPWRHEPRMLTNRRLMRLAALAGIGCASVSSERASDEGRARVMSDASERGCGALYGSALVNLLREDGRVSGSLPNRRAALQYGVEVLRFVRTHMPALEFVVCLGREAREAAEAAFGVSARDLRAGGFGVEGASEKDATRVGSLEATGRVSTGASETSVALAGEREERVRASVRARGLVLVRAGHPAARISTESLEAPWRALAVLLRRRKLHAAAWSC